MVKSKANAVGRKLLKHSKGKPLRAFEGFVGFIYPQVLAASRRMTVREISEWLKRNHGVYVSAVTVAKALREQAKNWDICWREALWSAVADVCRAHDVRPENFLFDRVAFSKLKKEKPVLRLKRSDDSTEGFFRVAGYTASLKEIEDSWFSLDDKLIAEFVVPLAAAIVRARDDGCEPICSVLQRPDAKNPVLAATD